MSLFTIFTANAPVMLKPYEFEVVVANKAQENLFRDEKPNLMNYLRVGLRNFDIEVRPGSMRSRQPKDPIPPLKNFSTWPAKTRNWPN